MTKRSINLKINGKEYDLESKPNNTLLNLLRDELGLTGSKDGCQEGECGTCTVLLDGQPVNSCLTLAAQCDGREVVTIEGIAKNGKLHPVQQAFVETGAVQCGYCTPGMILSSVALLETNLTPSDAEIRTALAGNLCRCTGYNKIIEAVEQAAQVLQDE
ncbi:MAG: (2Fe-2S)-binding protein [Chloroflexota bacterium]